MDDTLQDMLYQWPMPNQICGIDPKCISITINADIYWSALVSMPQIWSGIDRYWSLIQHVLTLVASVCLLGCPKNRNFFRIQDVNWKCILRLIKIETYTLTFFISYGHCTIWGVLFNLKSLTRMWMKGEWSGHLTPNLILRYTLFIFIKGFHSIKLIKRSMGKCISNDLTKECDLSMYSIWRQECTGHVSYDFTE